MEEIKCKNCSGNDFVINNGVYICQNCGSKYVVHNELLERIDLLEDKMIDAIHRDEYETIEIHSAAILRLDPQNAYAWTGRMMSEIAAGITLANAGRIVEAAQKAADYASKRVYEEREDIENCIKRHFEIYYYRIMEEDPGQKSKEEALMRQLNCDAASIASGGMDGRKSVEIKSLAQERYEKENAQKEDAKSRIPDEVNSIYDIKVMDLQGNRTSLERYQGKVLLIVNSSTRWSKMASDNYQQMRKLYKSHHEKGFEILDFPCLEFDHLYPNPIATLWNNLIYMLDNKVNNKFKRFETVRVNGDNENILFSYLKSKKGGDIETAFTSFLVDRDGNVRERFTQGHWIIINSRLKDIL